MNQRRLFFAALAALLGTPAFAADMPLKAPPAAVASGNWYFWIDGMYENVGLPSYGLGFHNVGIGSQADLGPAQNFEQRLDGAGVRGALGYMLPGSNVKVEIGGFYVAAKGSSSEATTLAAGATPVLLNGSTPGSVTGGFLCNGAGGFTCTTAGTLSANYDAWQINGKIAADRRFGIFTITPSLTVFGGNTHNSDSFSQAFTQFAAGAVFRTGSYSASTALNWTDAGGSLGLNVSVPVSTALTFAVGGWIGGASRTVSLSGSDASIFPTTAGFNGASAVSANDSRGVFLANAEASLAYALRPNLTLRGFGGINYDGSVPGIAGPSFSGPLDAQTSHTGAGITYAAETSYYAGGGFEFRF
jgi:hypothetical protein